MNTITPTQATKTYTIPKNAVNEHKAILPNTLRYEMENFIKSVLKNSKDINLEELHLYKLQILKNAYLNDELLLSSQIKKFNNQEIHYLVKVQVKNKDFLDTICSAIFKTTLQKQISQAS
jgi:hypothetical protein